MHKTHATCRTISVLGGGSKVRLCITPTGQTVGGGGLHFCARVKCIHVALWVGKTTSMQGFSKLLAHWFVKSLCNWPPRRFF